MIRFACPQSLRLYRKEKANTHGDFAHEPSTGQKKFGAKNPISRCTYFAGLSYGRQLRVLRTPQDRLPLAQVLKPNQRSVWHAGSAT